MKPISAFALALLALPAAADEAADRVQKALDVLAGKDGYKLDARWTMEGEKLRKPVTGTVESTVRQGENFMRLDATFEDGSVTVYQKGDVIAAQDPETKKWAPASKDPKTKFVLKMFNLKSFLSEAAGMAINGRVSKADRDEFLHIEFDAEPGKLKALLGDAEAGQALLGRNGSLENATMKVSLDVERSTGQLRVLAVHIEGDSKHEPRKVVGDGKKEKWEEWTGDEDKDKTEKKDGEGKPEPKKDDPQADPATGQVQEHIKIDLQATPDYNARTDNAVPEDAKKVLGM